MSKTSYILVAEDNATYAKIYNFKLSKEGYEVKVVNNGNEVIEEVNTRKPDLILLDLIMPKKDGFETLTELKGNEKTKDVKVVVFSNLGQEEDINKAKELGASGYITKSDVSVQGMVEKIKKYL